MSNITIDGTQYPIASLSDEAKSQLASLQIVDQKIIDFQQQISIFQTARNAYANRLKELLPDSC
jgi:hypothetical protein